MESINLDQIFKELDTINKDDSNLSDICVSFAQAITEKQTTIHKIVENAGFLLVNQSGDKRELGTFLLSQILDNLPNDFLSSTELHFISSFYCDRLKDNHQVIPSVLIGINALIQMNNLPEGAPHKLLTSMFENVPCQQQQMKDRQIIYQIFREILNRRTTEINAMGIDFVLGVLQSIDGERDPRNLLFLFNWLPTFLSTVKLGHLTEEMFDVIACYFPVDFRAPPQDSQSITREDLSSALCPCLCAVPEFAEFCLPLLIDKLNSSLKIAKHDSLNLLTESCKTFDVSIYEQHSHDIWNILQKETLNSSDPEIEEASLNCISAIINRLSLSDNHTLFKQTVDNLYETLKGNLRPETKLFLPSSKILIAVARASKESCHIIVQPTVALLLNHYNLTKDRNQKEILFRTLMEFAVAYLKLFDVINIMQVDTLNEIPSLCLHACILENELQVISFESCSRIAKMLPENIRSTLYQLLKTKIVQNEAENVRNSILKCFKTYANLYKNEVINEFLSFNNKPDLVTLQLYLEALSCIVSEKVFAEIILPQVLQLSTNDDVKTAEVSIKCLRDILQENSSNQYIQDYLYHECNIIDIILKWVLVKIEQNQSNFDLLENVSIVVKNIVGFRSSNEQNQIIQTCFQQLFTVFLNQDFKLKDKIIVLLEGVLVRIRPDVVIEQKYILIKDLLKITDRVPEHIYLYACMIIANLINKSSEDEHFIETLNEIDSYVTNSLDTISNDLHLRNIIQLISWLTKALIIKGSNRSDVWTDKLILLLEKYEDVGKSFRLIMDDNHDCLTSKSYCTNRLLYRQKFFAYVCKKISSTYNEEKPNYLLALGYLLQLAPLQVIILYFKETLRLLIFCLEQCKDAEALCAVLNTLCVLIHEKEPYLENHIDDLLPRFLNLTIFGGSMKVRIAAIKCIKEFPHNYPVFKLLPHKQDVIIGLSFPLDDKKRLVRREAVEARSLWFLLDAPT